MDVEPLQGEIRWRLWNALPQGLKDLAVYQVQRAISVSVARDIRLLMENDPQYWALTPHGLFGGCVCSQLRDVIDDSELPTANWGDYYVVALEEAVGGP